ncbi:MAG: hypothetical protein IJ745_04110 [Bacteroidales bacterium]|nr:hypothetical protein [Bacteroidales bacterium]
MKRLILILLLMMPLALAAQGTLYKQYAQRTDLSVAEVAGLKLNDTVKVDVVIIVADDAAAWERLKKELDIRTDKGVTSWLANPSQPSRRTAWNGKPACKVIASHSRRTVAIYLLNNETQYDALLDYQLDQMKNKK